MLNSTDFTAYVKDCAIEMGFDLVAITTAEEFENDRAAALERISSGHMDGLSWYTPERVQRGTRPEQLLPGARSIICLGLNYFDGDSPPPGSTATSGKVARYARGRDYHKVMKKRMRRYVDNLSKRLDTSISARWYVDDGPMLDRAAARRSGLGWFGKNSNILTPSLGSWIFLGQVITDLELEPDQTIAKTCGNCVRCIDACPTGAIVAPYIIDNTRCISYQTIENRGPIPSEMRPLMLDWVFGCDICQEVCPVNRKARPSIEPAFQGKQLSTLDLAELLELTDAEFLRKFQGTPIMRAKRVGLARNACVALGNQGDLNAIPALAKAMVHDEPLVRGHGAWALGKIGGDQARTALRKALTKENDEYVRQEIADAIQYLEVGSKKSGGAAAMVSQATPGVATPSQPVA